MVSETQPQKLRHTKKRSGGILMSFPRLFLKYALLWAICAAILSACAPSGVLANATTAASNVATSTAIPAPIVAIASPTIVSQSKDCKIIHTISICVQNIERSSGYTQVKLKISTESNDVTGFGNSFIFPDGERGLDPILRDENERSYSLSGSGIDTATFDDTAHAYYEMLYFQAVPADVKELTVVLPIVAINIPAKAGEGFQLDLGENPQPGTKDLDITTVIEGQTFHFVRAEFEGDGINSLRVTLYTDPLNLPSGDIMALSPTFENREKGIFFGSKLGGNGLPFQTFSDLVIPPGKSSGLTKNTYITGILDLKADRVSYWFRGPFELQYKFP